MKIELRSSVQCSVFSVQYKIVLKKYMRFQDLLAYKKGFEEEVLSIIDQSSICTEDTVVIVESSLDTEIPDFEKLKVIRVKEYKTNKHTFLMKTVED